MTARIKPARPKPARTRSIRPRTKPVATVAIAALACGALLLGGCTSKPQVQASQSATDRQLVFAHAGDATSTVVATVYAQMLDDAGIKATLGKPVPDPVAEVLAGRADVAVAGTGELLATLQKLPGSQPTPTPAPTTTPSTAPNPAPTPAGGPADPARIPLTAEQTLKALHGLTLEGYALLDSAAAFRTGTLVTTAATSAGKNLTALAQLPGLCTELAFGVPDGLSAALLPELQDSYDCVPARVLPVDPSSKEPVSALIANQVQVLATTAENAGIADNALVPLADAQTLFPPQALTPMITTREFGQDAIDAINKVSGQLKQEDLVGLNRAVTGPGALAPTKAATDWLTDKSLVVKH